MKVDFLRKAKWYIVGFILIAVMLSVSLSFCAWDTLSFKAVMNAKGGDFTEKAVWSDYIKDKDGNDLSDVPAVGTIVQYGKFYQKSGATTTEPQRWIVVNYDSSTKVATLLTEQIVVSGNFWGQYNQRKYQNYYQSTVRSWLNSGKGSLQGSGANWDDAKRDVDNARNDGLTSFSGISSKGFLDIAFTDGAEKLLVPKRIEGIQGKGINNIPSTIETYETTDKKDYINDLVWLPSYQEIYGTKENPWGTLNDGTPNTHFSYFDDVKPYNGGGVYGGNLISDKAKTTRTLYASGANSNYSGSSGSSDWYNWWMLRSPDPGYWYNSLSVESVGAGHGLNTGTPDGGVRPAVNVQL